MTAVRFGIVGAGNIAQQHAGNLLEGQVPGASLNALCSRHGMPEALADSGVRHFTDFAELMDSGTVDTVLIATPTMSHLEIGLAACQRGLHLVMEKPLGRSVLEGQRLVDAVQSGQTAAVMLNQRLDPAYVRIRELVTSGVLGEIVRVSWTMTNWYRPDVYFLVSDWRGTWEGEGGGLLLNQCIHNLDILQWILDLPVEVSAQAGFGKFHDIDVEDEVCAWLRFPNGASGVFLASTGEVPGRNQLDIVGNRGTVHFDGETTEIVRVGEGVAEHCRSTREMFGTPATEAEILPPLEPVNQHAALLENVVASIRGDAELDTPLSAGLAALELANAMLLSAWTGRTTSLPIDRQEYAERLAAKIAGSSLREAQALDVDVDMSKSYR